MLIVAALSLLKMTCFKVKSPFMTLAITFSIVSMAFAFESHFDNESYNAPLFITAIPISMILLSLVIQ